MLDDELSLIQRARRGHRKSFGLLYDRYLTQIYRFIYLKVNDRQTAEDLAHEVFASAWANLKGYRHQGFPFSSWLYRIARNRVIDYYRVLKPHLDLENVSEELIRTDDAIPERVDETLNVERVLRALKQLKPDQQDVIIMRFVEGLSHEEIAEGLDKTPGAVRLIQHRAIGELRRLLNSGEHGTIT